MEERLADSLVNSVENSKQHTDVLTKEEELEQQTELLQKKENTQKPNDFYLKIVL